MKNYPTRYIHEPWNAPEQVQKAAKCIVGTDYPVPMVDHNLVARSNQDRMRQVYQQLSTYKPAKSTGKDLLKWDSDIDDWSQLPRVSGGISFECRSESSRWYILVL